MIDAGERVRLLAKAGAPMRVFLLNAAIVILIGVWLTGFDKVHWFIYFVPGMFLMSSALGICPGLNLWRMLLKQ